MGAVKNQVTFNQVEKRKLIMPSVNGKKFPYTPKGKEDAEKEKIKAKKVKPKAKAKPKAKPKPKTKK